MRLYFLEYCLAGLGYLIHEMGGEIFKNLLIGAAPLLFRAEEYHLQKGSKYKRIIREENREIEVAQKQHTATYLEWRLSIYHPSGISIYIGAYLKCLRECGLLLLGNGC